MQKFFRCIATASTVGLAALTVAPSANAVVFDESSLFGCYVKDVPYVSPGQSRRTINLEFFLCEDTNYFDAIFVGDRIQPGQSISVNWTGAYWQGNLTLAQGTTSAGTTEVVASGFAQHLVPDIAPAFTFDDIYGGGTGDPTKETIQVFGGTVPHPGESDDYFGDFSLDEGRALLGVSTGSGSSNATRRGWLFNIEGFHGPGPFVIDNVPGGGPGGGGFPDWEPPETMVTSPIPLPFSGILLSGGVLLMAGLRRRRKHRS